LNRSLSVSAIVGQLLASWWVLFFALLCYVAYEQSLRSYYYHWELLTAQASLLQKQQEQARHLQRELKASVNSQQDPAWIELTLMRQLGVVPEGQWKAVFTGE
jgi:Tfp pilus assembly protein PilE